MLVARPLTRRGSLNQQLPSAVLLTTSAYVSPFFFGANSGNHLFPENFKISAMLAVRKLLKLRLLYVGSHHKGSTP